MTDYTRVTVQGEALKADLVLPDDEPVAALMPDVLALVGDAQQRSARPVALVTTVGEQLDASLTLAEQQVAHGTILRIARLDEAPPPPEVADVTEIVADAGSVRPDAWRPVWAVTAAAAAALAMGVLATTWWAAQADPSLGQVLIAVAVLTGVSALGARRGTRGPAVIGTAAAVGAAFVVSEQVAAHVADGLPAATALIFFALTCVLVGMVGVVGFRDRSLAVGGATGLVLVGGWILLDGSGLTTSHAAAILAVVGTLAVGLLPGIAMTLSGLSGMDDRVFDGDAVVRSRAERTVDTMFRALTWAVVAAAVPIGAALAVLAAQPDGVAEWLTVAVSLIVLLRARIMPLVPQRLALFAAGGAGLALLLVTVSQEEPAWALGAALAVIVALAAAVGSRPSEHTKAQLRRWANILELLAVLAVVPLLLAMLGIFADLVETF